MADSKQIATRIRRGGNWRGVHLLLVLLLIAVAVLLMLPAFQGAGKRPMPLCMRNLRMIGHAINQYHDTHGCYPPAVVKSPTNRPMHSWRALILPQLASLHQADADWLYEHGYHVRAWTSAKKARQLRRVAARYNFAEPWNGPNNQPLAAERLDAFCCPDGKNSTCDYLAVVGEQTSWPKNGRRNIGQLRDGASSTMLVVEVFGGDVRWSEPRDLDFATMRFEINCGGSDCLRGPHANSTNAVFADGHVSYLPDDLDPATVKAMLTIDGKETIRW